MRVAFNFTTFFMQEYGGISRYICRLATHLSEIPGVEAHIFAPLHVNAYLPTIDPRLVTGIKVHRFPKPVRISLAANQLISIPLIRVFNPDIVHESHYSANAYAPRGACRVITLHDMTHERFPGMFTKNDHTVEWKKSSIARADHIICISESTRRDLLELYDVQEEKTSVVYHGFDAFTVTNDSSAGLPCLRNFPYILYVGQRGGYKNFSALIKAYASSEWLRSNVRLVCFGGGAFSQAEKEMFIANTLSENTVLHIGGDDLVLAACYQNAAAFVYPSLYEGFGIPLLEAMSVGCPVICSKTSSIPEVVGCAGAYFDPASVESIRASIEEVLQSSKRRADLIEKGLERCKLFTWEKCAQETTSIYRSILRKV